MLECFALLNSKFENHYKGIFPKILLKNIMLALHMLRTIKNVLSQHDNVEKKIQAGKLMSVRDTHLYF